MAEADITLRDGRSVHVRALRPADEAEMLQAFERLSDAARYMRFMRVVREPDPERLRAVLASFPEEGIGIVATVPAADEIDIVGSAIAVFAADRASCEFAITVSAGFGGSSAKRGAGAAPKWKGSCWPATSRCFALRGASAFASSPSAAIRPFAGAGWR